MNIFLVKQENCIFPQYSKGFNIKTHFYKISKQLSPEEIWIAENKRSQLIYLFQVSKIPFASQNLMP